jgi:general secretion pathway protein A
VYPKYFGLKEPSFSIAPDPHYLFLSEQHKEALAHLLYGAGENGGFVLLTGEVGTGKTTVCRAFLEQLPEGVDVALIVNPAMTANELLLNCCDEFRIPVPEGERSVKFLVDRLNEYLLAAHARGRRPVLMIDEAQNLRPKVLEQIRLLTNLETTKDKLLQIFLIGQPELRRMLGREGLRQLDQRITARFHLRPLNAAGTAEYIRHRVAVAGVDRPLFTAAAIRRIHQLSGGVPRVINILCDRALLGACVSRVSQVTPRVVTRAAREVRGEGVRTAPPPPARPAFALAAAVTLMLTALWLVYDRLPGVLPGPVMVGPAVPTASRSVPAAVRTTTAPAVLSAPVAARIATPAAVADDSRPTVTGIGNAGVAAVPAPVLVADTAAAPAAVPAEVAGPVVSGEPPVPVTTVGADAPAGPTQGAGSAAPLPRVSLVGALVTDNPAEALARAALPEEAALRVLLRRWGISVQDLGSGDPCGRVAVFGLRCEREQGRLSHVRFYDRPVLLRVRDASGERRYAVLGALSESAAGLDLPQGSESVPIGALESVWTGDYTVVWQPPPSGASVIGPGAAGESVRWLRRLLTQTPGSGFTDSGSGRFDAPLTAALRAFQTSRGLSPDGIAGPRTLVQLNNAVATPGIPHLMTAPLAAAVAAQGAGAVSGAGAAVPSGAADLP